MNYKVYGLGKHHPAGLYTPLSILQITTDDKSIRTAQRTFVPQTIQSDPHKRCIALFLSEILFDVLRHPMQDEPMYDFLESAIRELDILPPITGNPSPVTGTPSPITPLSNFHLRFLTEFAAQLGFAIPVEETEHGNILPSSQGRAGVRLPLTRSERQQALRSLCDYFAEHIDTWHQPKSLDILMEVFD